MDTKDLLTIKQVAEYHKMSVPGVHKAILRGELQTQEVLGVKVINRADCEAWKPSGRGGARPGSGPKPRSSGASDAA